MQDGCVETFGRFRQAIALWKAEDSKALAGNISAPWGCVGMLASKSAPKHYLRAWANHFRENKVLHFWPVDRNGEIRIPWPLFLYPDGTVGVDLIFATATRAEETVPPPENVADAWLKQNQGHENYFFENVQHGIRTPDDLFIWKRIEEADPPPRWLANDEYASAVDILRKESHSSNLWV